MEEPPHALLTTIKRKIDDLPVLCRLHRRGSREQFCRKHLVWVSLSARFELRRDRDNLIILNRIALRRLKKSGSPDIRAPSRLHPAVDRYQEEGRLDKKGSSMDTNKILCSGVPASAVLCLTLFIGGCAIDTSAAPPDSQPAARQKSDSVPRHLDPQQAERLKAVMTPFLQKMDHPIALDSVRVAIMDDSHINAANAGGGEFYVTTGLLQKANDEQLAGVLAHEVAHADLGHVTKLQTIGAGTNIAAVLLGVLGIPGADLVPLAGDLLVARPYGRDAEYAADRHGAELLQRTGRDGKQMMAATLTWLMQAEGSGAGGFFATHPATEDRIDRMRRM